MLILLCLQFSGGSTVAASRQDELKEAKELYQQVAELDKQGRYADAIPLARQVLVIREKVLGTEHPHVAASLNNLALLYKRTGAYAQAIPLYERAIAIDEKVHGPEHPDVAICLNNLARLYADTGLYAKAVPLYERALVIFKNVHGPEHPLVVNGLNKLASFYKAMEAYAKAEPLYQQALALTEKAKGPEHPDVATRLDNLAALYEDMGLYARAVPLYERALAIDEKINGPEHYSVATSLHILAVLCTKMGAYVKARSFYQRALAIIEKAKGREHPDVAACLNNLAMLYKAMGDYEKVEPLYQRALAIQEKVLGPEHADVATSLNNLANLYSDMGADTKAEPLLLRALVICKGLHLPALEATCSNNLAGLYRHIGAYGKAAPMYLRSLEIREKVLGDEHPDVAESLSNLAGLYQDIGDYGKAAPLYQRSLEIQEKLLGPEHPNVATSLNNLAGLYRHIGAYGKAAPMYLRSLEIREKVLGDEHPDVAESLSNLAGLYQDIGNYGKAESLYQRSLAIREKVLGPEHPDVAICLNNLALLYADMGLYAKAVPLYEHALAINEKVDGSEHPEAAAILSNLASLKAAQENHLDSFGLFLRSLSIDKKTIDQVMGFTSEKQKLSFLATRQNKLNGFFSLVVNHLADDPTAQRAVFDTWISRKGVALEAQSRFQEALVYSDDADAIKVFQQLAQVRAQLSKLVFAGPGQAGAKAYRQRIAELEKEKQQLEASLSHLSQAYALKKKIETADGKKIAACLPTGSVLLDFARVKMFDFKAWGQEKRWRPARYIVFVLHAGNGDRLAMIDLGEAGRVDTTINRFKRQINNEKDILKGGQRLRKSAQQLYNLVFAPITEALGETKEIFISPDGNLNLIPFEVLQTPDGKYLIEAYTFNYLAASRDVLGVGEIKEKAGKAVIIGDPDFDLGAKPPPEAADTPSGTPVAKRSVQMSGLHFTRLAGTEKEVRAVRNLLGKANADVYMGLAASEAALFSHGTPRILHLATHGFFLDDQDLSALADQNGLAVMSSPATQKGRNVIVENPLLRSGIALAGANTTLKTDTRKSDGIVTAEKILGLKLRGTQMVVLSACQTGVGQVQSGEGVFGLRRAFVQAGTQSLVMSMWSVPDRETQELMVQFYSNIAAGMNRSQALRQAALEEMQIAKARYGHAHPLFWGAFVFLGES